MNGAMKYMVGVIADNDSQGYQSRQATYLDW